MIALGRALAVELAPKGVRVNTVVPGYVRTPMLQPHLDANEGYEEWIVSQTPQAASPGPRSSRRTSCSCCPDSLSTFTERRLSSMAAGSRDSPVDRTPRAVDAAVGGTWRTRLTGRDFRDAALLGDLGRDGAAVRRQPAARPGQRQPQRAALDAAVRRDPRDRRDRPDARHPAARARPVGRRG